MAGTDPGFNATEFRNAILFAMDMGLPNQTEDTITFYFEGTADFDVEDNAGNPYEWDAIPVSEVATTSVAVSCAVEFIPRSTQSAGNAIADFDTPRLVVTVLDEQWSQIEGFDYLIHSGNTYDVEYVRPKVALFGVDVIQVECVARDES